MPREPAIAAHRGGALLWPENSLTAIRNAAALAIEQVEIDVHLSADGVPVVIHDATLDRTAEASGPVRGRTAAALAGCRLRGGVDEGVPTLAEAAALVRDAGRMLRLELKTDREGRPYPGDVAACLAVLDRVGMRGRTVLIAFAPSVVAAAAGAGLSGTAMLFGAAAWHGFGLPLALGLCRSVGASEIGVPFGVGPTADTVAACRVAGLALGAWGVDRPGDIEAARALGLDVLTTDDPVAALAARRAGQAVAGAVPGGL